MRTLVGGQEIEDADAPTSDAAVQGHGRTLPALPAWVPNAALAAVVLVGIILRLYSRSNLWLDEALSVNIAKLPPSDLLEALRHDGHPPLYYLLLHAWMKVFGEGDVAVRALSSIFGIAILPLVWIAGRRIGGSTVARWSLAVVALSPYCVRYSTEARMYSLVMLLVLAGYLVLTDALRAPTWPRLVAIALVSGLLLLSHYWAFWLLGGVGLLLLWRWRQQPDQRPTLNRILLAIASGGVLFLPWLPSFLYQSSNTGTPWAGPVRPAALVEMTMQDMGGGEFFEGKLGGAFLLILCLLGLFVVRSAGREIVLDVHTASTVRLELAIVGVTAGLGWLTAYATGATYQARYAAVFAPFVLLAAAVGITRVPGPARLAVAALFFGFSLAGIGWVEYYQRTQSGQVAAAVAARAEPGDVVVYCPDQLGPDYSREMPDDLVELAYPTLDPPDRVDWVDYKERNANVDPAQVAAGVRERANGHAVFVVWMADYQTFGTQCEDFINSVSDGAGETLVWADESAFYEPAYLHWVPASD